MKLIIDIPNTTYAFIKQLQWVNTGRGNCKIVQQTVINSIKFGVKQQQGEWIYLDKDDVMKVECPFCHNRQCCISNYCDYCGADMRGDKND